MLCTHTVVVDDLFVPEGRGTALPYQADGRFDDFLSPTILSRS
nr:hypothetical protein [Actinoplanes polyasparticus]